MDLTHLPRRLAAAVNRIFATRSYHQALRRGEPAGSFSYRFVDWPSPDPPLVELRLRADGADGIGLDEARRWCRRQTLSELRAVGLMADGTEAWRIEPRDERLAKVASSWFAAPGYLPEVISVHLESCMLIAAAEAVDAVVLRERVGSELGDTVTDIKPVHRAALRPWALYRTDAYAWDEATDTIRPTHGGRLAKLIDTSGVAHFPSTGSIFNRLRRGPYLSDEDFGPVARVALRDASLLHRRTIEDHRPAVLVTVPFLARGGAEQTLHATMAALSHRFRFSMATLAPHRASLGDRRDDFLEITERIFCLGDLVHPDAMLGMLLSILDTTGAEILYNANGTTLFYDFAPRLKTERPDLWVIDHLYDHHIGYIDSYVPGVEDSVDVCVAENRPIADVLVGERGWPETRVPVIWPCGRPDEALPPEAHRDRLRDSIRNELGIDDDDVVLLTAARMHEQKRPLDLVALADRVRDLEKIHFVLVGGGDLEDEVDRAIKNLAGARIRRLAFRNDIPDLILASDIGCLVSEHEGLPVFMLECLQLGRPFLGTRVGDLGTVLDSTGAGLVVDQPGDLDALEAAVRELSRPAIRSQLAERARAASPRFSVEVCADAYARVFLDGS
jgi:glycosyltransferase involved in cell wall biosynthesis